MKKTVSILIALILLLGVLPVGQITQADAPGTYNTGDIAVINRIIDENDLMYDRVAEGYSFSKLFDYAKWPKAPADGSSVPREWQDKFNEGGVHWSNDATNKRIVKLVFYRRFNPGSTYIYSGSTYTIPMEGDLDLRSLDVLETLHCSEHDITGLDLSGCPKLKNLNNSGCENITQLDLRANTALESVDINWNRIADLKFGNCPNLTYLNCSDNPLGSLDVTGLPKLKELYCNWNGLTSLDVSKNTLLSVLDCKENCFKYYYDIVGIKNVPQSGVSYRPQNVVQVGPAGGKYTILGVVKGSTGANHICDYIGLGTEKIGGTGWIDNAIGRSCSEFEFNGSFSEGYPEYIALAAKWYYDNGNKSETEHYSTYLPFYPEPGYTYEVECKLPIWLFGWSDGNMSVKLLSSKVTVPVTSVKLNASSKTLAVGGTTTLTPTVSPSNATNKTITWKSSNTAVATVDSNGKVTAKAPGKATITVTTVDGGKTATCVITVKPKTPTSVKAAVVSATSAKISWGAVSGATGYEVRRATSKNGTYKAVKTTTGTSFTNTKLKAGQTYYYKVRAYKTIDGKKIYGAYSSIVSVKPKPLKVTGVKATKIKSGQAKISWSKQANVSGYQIVRATSKNGTYKSVKTTSKLTYTDKKLEAGKTYYYKVRAYKTVSGKKVYGAYSGIKSVKV